MAIDKQQTETLIQGIEDLFDGFTSKFPPEVKAEIRKIILGPALDEIKELITNSRMPVMYVIGRSGHGKSSLINTLAGKEVAETSDIKPGTIGSTPYVISFSEQHAAWKVIDSRGIFESTSPAGAPPTDAVTQVHQDLDRHNPDVILHVISAPEVRTLSNDMGVLNKILNKVTKSRGGSIPVISVINKSDLLGSRREWPPEEFPRKAGLIYENTNYLAKDILKVEQTIPIDRNGPLKGLFVDDENYVAIVPCCSHPEDLWNIDTLSEVIGEHLPKSARLDFYQAQQRKRLLRRVSTQITQRFAAIAGGIGAIPIPLSDMAILIPLQMLLISIIGGLSCRPFTGGTAYEYLSAAGVNLSVGFGARELFRQLIKLVPGLGSAVSAAVAATTTWGIGKAAEAYFFAGELHKPEAFGEPDLEPSDG